MKPSDETVLGKPSFQIQGYVPKVVVQLIQCEYLLCCTFRFWLMINMIEAMRIFWDLSDSFSIWAHYGAFPTREVCREPILIQTANRYQCVPHLRRIQHLSQSQLGAIGAIWYVDYQLPFSNHRKTLFICSSEGLWGNFSEVV
jgi:hypothetical protein